MSSVLEQIRCHHIDVEQLQRDILQHLIAASSSPAPASSSAPSPVSPASPPSHVLLSHLYSASLLVPQWREALRRVVSLHSDDEELLSSQLRSITDDSWASFYSTLSSLRFQSRPPPPPSTPSPLHGLPVFLHPLPPPLLLRV